LQGLIGFFSNTLVLRVDVGGDPPFTELLQRVRAVVLEALAHQDVPFDELVGRLRPTRASGRHPIFQVAYAHRDFARLPERMDDVTLELQAADTGTAKADLMLTTCERRSGLGATLEYDTGRYERAVVTQLLDDFEQVLRAVARDGPRPLSRLPVRGLARARPTRP
jgi:non-ribosomal peptide synthetase component F